MKDKRLSLWHSSRTPKLIAGCCAAIILSNVLALFAAHHWAFDLFSNFKIQYFAGCLIILPACLAFKKYYQAGLMAFLALGLFVEINIVYTKPWQMRPPAAEANFKIAQYNKFFFNRNYDDIGAWLRDPSSNFDMVIVNESLPNTIEPLKAFADILPYQFPENPEQRFGDISVLSKYPIEVTPLIMPLYGRVHTGSKIVVQKPGLQRVAVYAYHAQVPLGGKASTRRAGEMRMMAEFASQSSLPNTIMVGDWNLTPWSPLFKDVVKTSGLNYQNYGLFPRATWPSFALLPFLKIPIDHVLFSDSLTLTDIRRGPALGSDHHSLIADFRVSPVEYQ